MKAKQIINRYAAGERDFRGENLGENLRWQNFKGADLSGADFSNADIRGANFSNANLRGVKFNNTKAGYINDRILVILLGSLIIIISVSPALLVLLLLLPLFKITLISFSKLNNYIFGNYIFGNYVTELDEIVNRLNSNLIDSQIRNWVEEHRKSTIKRECRFLISLVSPFIFWGALTIIPLYTSEVFDLHLLFSGTNMMPILVVIAAIIPLFAIEALNNSKGKIRKTGMISLIDFVEGRTNFQSADLTDADFSSANLAKAYFEGAVLTRTKWFKVEYPKLNLKTSRQRWHGETKFLTKQLLISGNGSNTNFDYMDLSSTNLCGANLTHTSFVGTDLSHSNLQEANLVGANLKQAKLEGTDLRGAILTGAYIEDWGITSTTKLENVQCEYVYMCVPTKEKPNPLRKPDNLRETFAEGEFADFIQPLFDTLDLYHSQGVDPRAISIALKNLSDNHPDDNLQFVAMERRGNTGLNLRFTTTPGANKSELSHEYFSSYARIRKELPIAVQIQLADQYSEIRTLKGTIEQFIQTGTHRSTIQAETIQVIQGELIVTENRGINIQAGNNANISGLVSGDGIVNLGTISGNVTNAINQLPDPSESEQPNLKALLTQLQQAIETDTNLPDPDKSDLLEQVQALAEAKQTEEPAKREGITRKAMKMFDATLKSLPDTAKIAEACSKLLPLILKALGFPA